MIYCGIDLSTTSTGLSILNEEKLIYYECIKPDKKLEWEERIGVIFERLNNIFSEYPIEKIYIEEIPLKDGKPTLVKLAAVRGAFIACAYLHNIPFQSVLPVVWRHECGFCDGTQNGLKRKIMKEKAIQKVKNMYDIDVNDDIAESILIGYSQHMNNRS